MSTIGERIKELRENLKMSQDELGKRCGTTKQTIFKYETGIVTNIPMPRIECIAKALNTTPTILMGWEDSSADKTEESLDEALERAFSARPEMRMLYSVTKNASAEDIEKTIKIIEALKGESD